MPVSRFSFARLSCLSAGAEVSRSEAANARPSSALFPGLLEMMLGALVQALGFDLVSGGRSGTSKGHEVLVAPFVVCCDVDGTGPGPARSRRRTLRATRC